MFRLIHLTAFTFLYFLFFFLWTPSAIADRRIDIPTLSTRSVLGTTRYACLWKFGIPNNISCGPVACADAGMSLPPYFGQGHTSTPDNAPIGESGVTGLAHAFAKGDLGAPAAFVQNKRKYYETLGQAPIHRMAHLYRIHLTYLGTTNVRVRASTVARTRLRWRNVSPFNSFNASPAANEESFNPILAELPQLGDPNGPAENGAGQGIGANSWSGGPPPWPRDFSLYGETAVLEVMLQHQPGGAGGNDYWDGLWRTLDQIQSGAVLRFFPSVDGYPSASNTPDVVCYGMDSSLTLQLDIQSDQGAFTGRVESLVLKHGGTHLKVEESSNFLINGGRPF